VVPTLSSPRFLRGDPVGPSPQPPTAPPPTGQQVLLTFRTPIFLAPGTPSPTPPTTWHRSPAEPLTSNSSSNRRRVSTNRRAVAYPERPSGVPPAAGPFAPLQAQCGPWTEVPELGLLHRSHGRGSRRAAQGLSQIFYLRNDNCNKQYFIHSMSGIRVSIGVQITCMYLTKSSPYLT